MAEVVGRSGLISSGLHRQQRSRSPIRATSVTGVRLASRFPAVKLKSSVLRSSTVGGFGGRRIGSCDEICMRRRERGSLPAVSAQMTAGIIGRSHKWWEKGVQPNMKEVTSAQDLVDSLANAGNKLVVVEFFSPGCGGCKALHPKICQLAEQNPDVQLLQVNHEDYKSLAYSLGVHVLPFFRFYRGAQGRLCSFSCTNATIKKFKDALAKHTTDRCSLGPAKGLEEKELLALAANKDLGFSYKPAPSPVEADVLPVHAASQSEPESVAPSKSNDSLLPLPLPLPSLNRSFQDREQKNLVEAER
uniref:Thioredoxin domain-containing protein n=1 Tax=Kalanchoe fedtschenkoi TaxID=63787 RepID=A0A7N0T189_KALFE